MDMRNQKDKVILEFPVLWEAWECDSTAWVMERADGTRYLKMTSHGGEYEANPDELNERIDTYLKVLEKSREALALLPPNVEISGHQRPARKDEK
jgi:hypothetical protein